MRYTERDYSADDLFEWEPTVEPMPPWKQAAIWTALGIGTGLCLAVVIVLFAQWWYA